MKGIKRNILLAALLGFVTGVVLLVAVRYVTYKSPNVHYHANFALYINGQRDEFKSFTFYEEVQACTSGDNTDPKSRVHMHDNQNDVIHVHDSGVTWGDFFANLGYGLTNKAIQTDKGVYVDGQAGNELTFMLNGEKAESIANRVIQSEDVLLINYGKDDDATLKQRYDGISHSAGEFNTKNDPSSCSGSEELTPLQRIKKAIVG
jgi:hypothetical protein